MGLFLRFKKNQLVAIPKKHHTLSLPYSKQNNFETFKISAMGEIKQEYHSLYLLKAIGVLFVLMIHFHCYKSHYLEPLYRCGVPLFYTISGFFLYASGEDRQKEKIKKGIVKIIKLIFFFNVIYYLLSKYMTKI